MKVEGHVQTQNGARNAIEAERIGERVGAARHVRFDQLRQRAKRLLGTGQARGHGVHHLRLHVQAEAGNQVAGVIEHVRFSEGDVVKKGQVLVEIAEEEAEEGELVDRVRDHA